MFLKKVVFLVAVLFSQIANSADIVLTKKNTVLLRGEVSEESVSRASYEILKSSEPVIYLYLYSPGGSIDSGSHLITAIKGSGKKVKCIAATAMSMAFVILQNCDERLVLDSSVVMQHVASYSLSGREPNNAKMAAFISEEVREMDQQQADRIGISLEEFRAHTIKDWWLNGKEAIKNNVADKMVSVSCNADLINGTHKDELELRYWHLTLTWSDCPMIHAPIKIDKKSIGPQTIDSQLELLRFTGEI